MRMGAAYTCTHAHACVHAPGLALPPVRYSVLDKVVPGYYVRRNEDGSICDSGSANGTATENAMCGRLVVDDITMWAREYRVDGFRCARVCSCAPA